MSAADISVKTSGSLVFSGTNVEKPRSEVVAAVTSINEEQAPLDPCAVVVRVLEELVLYHSSPMARPTATAENIILFASSTAQLSNEIAASVTDTNTEAETYFTLAAKVVPALANAAAQLKGFYTRATRIQAIQEAIVKHTPLSVITEISYLTTDKKIIAIPKPGTQEAILKELSAKGNLYFYIEGVSEPLILVDYSVFTFKNGIMAWLAAIPVMVTLSTSLFKILNPESAASLDNPIARATGIIASTVPILTSLETARAYAYKQEVNVLKGYQTAMVEVYVKTGRLDRVKEAFVEPLGRFLTPASMLQIRTAIETARDSEAKVGLPRPKAGG